MNRDYSHPYIRVILPIFLLSLFIYYQIKLVFIDDFRMYYSVTLSTLKEDGRLQEWKKTLII